MRRWTRATVDRRCGGCGYRIPTGAPLQQVIIGTVTKVRCVACVGPAPPDLPADVGERRDPFFQQRLDRLANRLPIDWLERAARKDGTR